MADHNPYADLKKLFHEPNRLAIMTQLCGAPEGLSFTDLKEACDLTDGNLSRHVKALTEAAAVVVEKSFVGGKPRTTVHLSERGHEAFLRYLDALEAVLRKAARNAKAHGRASSPPAKARHGPASGGLPAT